MSLNLDFSYSSLSMYMRCPRMYRINHIDKVKGKTDYARLCGKAVHEFIKHLYSLKKTTDRPFYFFDIAGATGYWFIYWKEMVKDNIDKLQEIDNKEYVKYAAIGCRCIENYWKRNYGKPEPLFSEVEFKTVYYPQESNFRTIYLNGKLDQIRSVDLTSVAAQNLIPESTTDGYILDKYDPVVILDLKTGPINYNVETSDTVTDKTIRKQYVLQRNRQIALYTYLYKESHGGKLPLAFVIYALRYDYEWPVRVDNYALEVDLFEVIQYVSRNIEEGLFPPNVGRACHKCDFARECNGNNDFYISLSGNRLESVQVVKKAFVKIPKQLRLKWRYKK